ncbi:MAG: UDP-N-acetylmuramoyl-L-alanine--D-glutamate ligase [Candidatus Pacebacteria bacterium]|nr:UDP-N-acetylmuramoyl-L-alanine--D-glutamate ligase [Candidatus Paceibacterota bacterium]
MIDYKNYFKNKKVTVVGLGLLGKRLGDIAFLSECGADVTVTDIKTAKELAPSLKKLSKYKGIKYTLGEHRFEDFENKDFILKGQGVRLDSPYILHAQKNGIPIEMDESLFMKLAPDVKIVGITGTRGKSTTSHLIYEILKSAGLRVHLGGNIKGTAALPLLKKVKAGDIAVFELSSWQLQGFGDAKISPQIAVFTNFMPDHLNYYDNNLKKYFLDKSFIYKYQKKGDTLILSKNMESLVKGSRGKKIITDIKNIPKNWNINLIGKHNLENIACAIEVATLFNVKDEIIKKVVEKFEAVSGRLELVKKIKGVKIYNDTNSTTPDATIVALNSFSQKVILIMGGMDKNIDVSILNKILSNKTKKIFLTPGSGSDKIVNKKADIEKVQDLNDSMNKAMKEAKGGDIILFSPAFASFNMFKNEYDRGEKFMKIVNNLK